ncbi:MAG: helix-turn-helix transcriptional regulator [Acidobacteria bacterium]|nr:helix-turn-helix transcriptional regulator [Acidobacteriota bacterium]
MAKNKWEDANLFIEPNINAAGVHVWRFEPVLPIDVNFWTFGKLTPIRMNRHEYFELLLADSGEFTFEVLSRSVTIRQGDLFLMGSTLFHRLSGHSGAKAKGISLFFLPDVIGPRYGFSDDTQYLMPFLAQDPRFPFVVPAKTGVPGKVLGLMRSISAELPAVSAPQRLLVKTYLKMILALLAVHYAAYQGSEAVFSRRRQDLDRLRPVFEFVDQHYHEPITVQHAASAAHMSASHFARFFKQLTGQSFVTHLTHFRIEKAKELLAVTDKKIAEVSEEVGFCSQSYFGLTFRKLAEKTPGEYRDRVAALGTGASRFQGRVGAAVPGDSRRIGLA